MHFIEDVLFAESSLPPNIKHKATKESKHDWIGKRWFVSLSTDSVTQLKLQYQNIQMCKYNQITAVCPPSNVPFSQIEELYESYCLQKRLRDGASKMVKAYTSSAGSKEARESLAEASKGHKEYTEVSGQGVGKIEWMKRSFFMSKYRSIQKQWHPLLPVEA